MANVFTEKFLPREKCLIARERILKPLLLTSWSFLSFDLAGNFYVLDFFVLHDLNFSLIRRYQQINSRGRS